LHHNFYGEKWERVMSEAQANEPHVIRGILAGVAGGLAASWVMNRFLAEAGKKLTYAVQTDDQNWQDEIEKLEAGRGTPKEDATMKAADKVVSAVTGGRHLSWEEKEKAGPVVHYAFGALMGGIYGGAAEVAPTVTAGFGSGFGTALFGGADLIAVPALHLSPPENSKITPKLVSPFVAHLVYGATTEIVRRLVRSFL
jgi:putative membrane protein